MCELIEGQRAGQKDFYITTPITIKWTQFFNNSIDYNTIFHKHRSKKRERL